MFIWNFSVQHTVINDGAYNQAAFVPNASTLMYPLPKTPSSQWGPEDVLNCLPSQTKKYDQLGGMTFMDVQINASVTGQGPYPDTIFGRGVLEPSLDVLQDTYSFKDPVLRAAVDHFFEAAMNVGDLIQSRMDRDIANYYKTHPNSFEAPETVKFSLITPTNVMNTIQT